MKTHNSIPWSLAILLTSSLLACEGAPPFEIVKVRQPVLTPGSIIVDPAEYPGRICIGATCVSGAATTVSVAPGSYPVSVQSSAGLAPDTSEVVGTLTVNANGGLTPDANLAKSFDAPSGDSRLTALTAPVLFNFSEYKGLLSLWGLQDFRGPTKTVKLVRNRRYSMQAYYTLGLTDANDYLSAVGWGLTVEAAGNKASLGPGMERYFDPPTDLTVKLRTAQVTVEFHEYKGLIGWWEVEQGRGPSMTTALMCGRRYLMQALYSTGLDDNHDRLSSPGAGVSVSEDCHSVTPDDGAARSFSADGLTLNAITAPVTFKLAGYRGRIAINEVEAAADNVPVHLLVNRRYNVHVPYTTIPGTQEQWWLPPDPYGLGVVSNSVGQPTLQLGPGTEAVFRKDGLELTAQTARVTIDPRGYVSNVCVADIACAAAPGVFTTKLLRTRQVSLADGGSFSVNANGTCSAPTVALGAFQAQLTCQPDTSAPETTLTGQQPIALITDPLGGGNHDLAVIVDGDKPAAGTYDSSRQYDTWTNDPNRTEDWIGLQFATPKLFSSVWFQEGMEFGDGGWFETLTVQVRQGATWVPANNVQIAPYHGGAADGVGFQSYRLTFDPIAGTAVRLIGRPGGSGRFISVAELEAYGTEAPLSPIPVADAGPDQIVPGQAVAVLDGRGSSGPPGATLAQAWTQTAGPSVQLDRTNPELPSFITPTVFTTTTVTFSLVVSNGSLPSPADSVNITVLPADAEDLASGGAVIALITEPLGGGSHDLNVIRDGQKPAVGESNSSLQYDTYTGDSERNEDWIGYQFNSLRLFSQVIFQEGNHFGNGGWFETLTVQVRKDGSWVPVSNPRPIRSYPGGQHGPSFESFQIAFDSVAGDAIRIHGRPGGSARFISVGELEVLGTVCGSEEGCAPIQAPLVQEWSAIDWSVPDRALGHVGQTIQMLDPPSTVVNPDTWPVDLNGCAFQSASDPIVRWDWVLESPDGSIVDSGGSDRCVTRLGVTEQGDYIARLTTRRQSGATATGSRRITIRDYLIVSMGDSIASGEGVPDFSGNYPGGDPEARWEDSQCHRSWKSGAAKAALALEASDPRTSVTFISVACSGASIRDGLLGPYAGIESGRLLDPQLKQVVDRVARRDGTPRTIDALLMQAGANDLGFGAVAKTCLLNVNPCHSPAVITDFGRGVQGPPFAVVPALMEQLPGIYFQLGWALDAERAAGNLAYRRIFLGEYPDPVHRTLPNRTEADFCSLYDLPGFVLLGADIGISESEAEWAYEAIIRPLRNTIRTVGAALRWNVIPITDDFLSHGVCASSSWINSVDQSFSRQGDISGSLHPNDDGHNLYRDRIAERLATLAEGEVSYTAIYEKPSAPLSLDPGEGPFGAPPQPTNSPWQTFLGLNSQQLAHEDQVTGRNLRDLWPQVTNGEVFYAASWTSTTPDQQVRIFGMPKHQFQAKRAELEGQGWQLFQIAPYVIDEQVFYSAGWGGARDGVMVEPELSALLFHARNTAESLAGNVLTVMKSYVQNGQVFYSAIWAPGPRTSIGLPDWGAQKVALNMSSGVLSATDTEFRRLGYHLFSLTSYVFNGEVRYSAIWNRGTRQQLTFQGVSAAQLLPSHRRLTNQGWGVRTLTTYSLPRQDRPACPPGSSLLRGVCQ